MIIAIAMPDGGQKRLAITLNNNELVKLLKTEMQNRPKNVSSYWEIKPLYGEFPIII